jgi:hypothetical protein
MSDNIDLECGDDGLQYTLFAYGAPRTWAWAKNTEGKSVRGPRAQFEAYKNDRDFFDVTWQVNRPKRGQPNKALWKNRVRLQVESPNSTSNKNLNQIKLETIRAIQSSEVRQVVEDAGFGYETTALKIRPNDIAKYKTTTVFRVVLSDDQGALPPLRQIEIVHSAIGLTIDKIVRQMAPKVEKSFL